MIKVCFVDTPHNSGASQLVAYSRQTPGCTAVWADKLQGVSDTANADWFVVMNHIPDPHRFPVDRTILIGREPRHVGGMFVDFDSERAKAFPLRFHHGNGTCYLPAHWWVGLSYDELVALEYPRKSRKISTIVSGRMELQGHRDRLRIVDKFARRYPYMHVLGTIVNSSIFPPLAQKLSPYPARVLVDKADGLLSYEYSLAIENGVTDMYFSEKLIDTWLCWAFPIYVGCTQLGRFFPPEAFLAWDGLQDQDDWITAVSNRAHGGVLSDNIRGMARARDLILNKYNLWPTLLEIIETGGVSWGI